MSSSLRDTVEELNYIWKHINEFLYENGKPTLRHGKPGRTFPRIPSRRTPVRT